MKINPVKFAIWYLIAVLIFTNLLWYLHGLQNAVK